MASVNTTKRSDLAAALKRNDYRLVMEIIEPQSRVLDLGCGNGHLLQLMSEEKQVRGYGVELSGDKISECVEHGLSVFQGDIDEGLRDFDDQSFDYVILNQTLPITHKPPYVIDEMLRVGNKGIVSFANFGYWRIRLRLLFGGRMPMGESIPYEWYNTPNIHHLAINDFVLFCRRFGVTVLSASYFSALEGGKIHRSKVWPNMSAAYGLFVITKGD